MTVYERAWQVWPVLVMAARQRQTLTYTTLGRLIGMPQNSLGRVLEPLQSFCIINNLPPLTSIVVNKAGSPEPGYSATQMSEVPTSQARVYQFDWLDRAVVVPPRPADLEEAVRQRPSNGINTDEPEDLEQP